MTLPVRGGALVAPGVRPHDQFNKEASGGAQARPRAPPRTGKRRHDRERILTELMTSDRGLEAHDRERIFVQLMTSDRELEASREGSN